MIRARISIDSPRIYGRKLRPVDSDTVIECAGRCASFFVPRTVRLSWTGRPFCEETHLPDAWLLFTNGCHVAQRSLRKDEVGMKWKNPPEDDGNSPRKYYLSRCFAMTTRWIWLVPS